MAVAAAITLNAVVPMAIPTGKATDGDDGPDGVIGASAVNKLL